MTTTWKRLLALSTTLAGMAAISMQASAQCTPPATANGPDVIVGDLTGPSNYASSAGIEALSLGTTSCNIGNVWLNWFANNNNHPVIGGTLYRYSVVGGAGRFEQVGQSWLKHGFFALSQGLCCSGCQSTDGTHLGVRCSDPYTSGRNGDQPGLGPKWQVNADTGFFTYPPANPGWSGSTARRLQVEVADLEPTTGSTTKYYGESHYVTPDDAAANNQNNNASYRQMSVSGSGTAWSFGFIGSTQRTQSAIRAWPIAEPGVTLREVQVPNEGLLILGYKATDIGGGLWHYEYALYNMNSDKGVGTFSLPVPAGVTLSNIGFHDVAYRNGDGPGNQNYDGTDWPGTVSNGNVTWATTPFAVNPSANAIRWGTTYNFRFDANATPGQVAAMVDLFKSPGAPTSVQVDGPVNPTGGGGNLAFCFGDGSGTACPCGNNSAVGAGEGCMHSLGFAALLGASGVPSVSNDTITLNGSGMPDSSALYFQGTAQANGGAGTVFGDGLRCAAGTVIRLGTKLNFLGQSSYPVGADLPVSVKGAVAAGDVRTYQVWYRNSAAFCNPEGFNLSNGYQLTWAP